MPKPGRANDARPPWMPKLTTKRLDSSRINSLLRSRLTGPVEPEIDERSIHDMRDSVGVHASRPGWKGRIPFLSPGTTGRAKSVSRCSLHSK